MKFSKRDQFIFRLINIFISINILIANPVYSDALAPASSLSDVSVLGLELFHADLIMVALLENGVRSNIDITRRHSAIIERLDEEGVALEEIRWAVLGGRGKTDARSFYIIKRTKDGRLYIHRYYSKQAPVDPLYLVIRHFLKEDKVVELDKGEFFHQFFEVPGSLADFIDSINGLFPGGVEGDRNFLLGDFVFTNEEYQEILRIREKYRNKLILLAGAPASGKGFIGSRLAKILGLTHISFGDVVRKIGRETTDVALRSAIQEAADRGGLISDETALAILKKLLNSIEGGVILDGFPRTPRQARMLDEVRHIDLVIEMDVPEEVLFDRIESRVVCEKCSMVYSRLFARPKNKDFRCDRCGGNIVKRTAPDGTTKDTREVLGERIRLYRAVTRPLLDYYLRKGLWERVRDTAGREDMVPEELLQSRYIEESNRWEVYRLGDGTKVLNEDGFIRRFLKILKKNVEDKAGINPGIFKADITGLADTDLSDPVIERIGRAYGTWVKKELGKEDVTIVIGHDARHSSPRIHSVLIDAIQSTGINVIDIGMSPTPVLYNSIITFKADGGIMITGSHLALDYNGLRLFAGLDNLNTEQLKELHRLAITEDFSAGTGQIRKEDYISEYLEKLRQVLCQTAGKDLPLKGMRIVLDSANGTTGFIVQFLEGLGATVTGLHTQPDARFPNYRFSIGDIVDMSNLDELVDMVRRTGSDLGISFDPSGDRTFFVNYDGEIITGNDLLMILSKIALANSPGEAIVVNSNTSEGVLRYIESLGGKPVLCKTGYINIRERIKELRGEGTGVALGGETTGYILFPINDFYNDGLYTAVKLLVFLRGMSRKERKKLIHTLPHNYNSVYLRLRIPKDEVRNRIVEDINRFFRDRRYPILDLDGPRVTVPENEGWFIVRASKTEPKIALTVESKTKEGLKAILEQLRILLKPYPELDLHELNRFMSREFAKKEGFKKRVSIRPVDLKGYPLAEIFEGAAKIEDEVRRNPERWTVRATTDDEQYTSSDFGGYSNGIFGYGKNGDKIFYDDGAITIFWSQMQGNTIWVKAKIGPKGEPVTLLTLRINPFTKELMDICPQASLDLIAFELGKIVDKDGAIYGLIQEILILPEVDKELIRRIDRMKRLGDIYPVLTEANAVTESTDNRKAQGLLKKLMGFRYYPFWHVRQAVLGGGLSAIERISRIKPNLLPPEKIKRITNLFMEEDIRRDITAIGNLCRTDLRFIRDSFRIPELEISDIDELVVEYLDRGREKTVYTVTLYLKDGREYRIAVTAVRLTSDIKFFGLNTFSSEQKTMGLWDRLRELDPSIVPSLRAYRNFVETERYILPREATGEEGDWEEDLMLVARDFVEGITTQEIMDGGFSKEETRQATLESIKTYLKTWMLTKDEEGKGIFLEDPKPDNIILRRVEGRFGEGSLFDLDHLSGDATLDRALILLSFYYPRDVILEALLEIINKTENIDWVRFLPLDYAGEIIIMIEVEVDIDEEKIREYFNTDNARKALQAYRWARDDRRERIRSIIISFLKSPEYNLRRSSRWVLGEIMGLPLQYMFNERNEAHKVLEFYGKADRDKQGLIELMVESCLMEDIGTNIRRSAEWIKGKLGSDSAEYPVTRKREIGKEGILARSGLSFQDYVNFSLYDSVFGYFSSGGVRFGWEERDHFTTYPVLLAQLEGQPFFGGMTAEQIFLMWKGMVEGGSLDMDKEFQIVEFGGGKGDYAYEILSYIKKQAEIDRVWLDFYNVLRYRMVDINIEVKAGVEERMGEFEGKFVFEIGDVRTLSDPKVSPFTDRSVTGVIISFELLDNMAPQRVKVYPDGTVETAVAMPKVKLSELDRILSTMRAVLGDNIPPADEFVREDRLLHTRLARQLEDGYIYLSRENLYRLDLWIREYIKNKEDEKEAVRGLYSKLVEFDEFFIHSGLSPVVEGFLKRHRGIIEGFAKRLTEPKIVYIPTAGCDFIEGASRILDKGYVISMDYGGLFHHQYEYLMNEPFRTYPLSLASEVKDDFYKVFLRGDLTGDVPFDFLVERGRQAGLGMSFFGKLGLLAYGTRYEDMLENERMKKALTERFRELGFPERFIEKIMHDLVLRNWRHEHRSGIYDPRMFQLLVQKKEGTYSTWQIPLPEAMAADLEELERRKLASIKDVREIDEGSSVGKDEALEFAKLWLLKVYKELHPAEYVRYIRSPLTPPPWYPRGERVGEDKDEVLLHNIVIDERGNIVLEEKVSSTEKMRLFYNIDKVRNALMKLKEEYGIGIFAAVHSIEIVDNLAGLRLDSDSEGPLAHYADRVIRIDIDAFRGEGLLVDVLEHEFIESIISMIEPNKGIAEVTAVYRNVKRFLGSGSKYQDGILSVLKSSDNGLDPSGDYARLLEYVRGKKLTDEGIISVVVRYVLNTERYRHLAGDMGIDLDLWPNVISLTGERLEAALDVYEDLLGARASGEKEGIIEKAKGAGKRLSDTIAKVEVPNSPLYLNRLFRFIMDKGGSVSYKEFKTEDKAIRALSRLGVLQIVGDRISLPTWISDDLSYKILGVLDNEWHVRDIPDIASELLRVFESGKDLVGLRELDMKLWPVVQRLKAIVILNKEVIPFINGMRIGKDEKAGLIRIVEYMTERDPIRYRPGITLYILRIASSEGIGYEELRVLMARNDIMDEARALWSISPDGIEVQMMRAGKRRLYQTVWETVEREKELVRTDTGRIILDNLIEYWNRNIIILGKDIDVKTTVEITDVPGKVPIYLIVGIRFFYRGEMIYEWVVDIDLSSRNIDIRCLKSSKEGHGLRGEIASRVYLATRFISRLFGVEMRYTADNWQKEFYEDRIRRVYGDTAWERIKDTIDLSNIELVNRTEIIGSILSGLKDYFNRHGGLTREILPIIQKVYLGIMHEGGDLVQAAGPLRYMTRMEERVAIRDTEEIFRDDGYVTGFSPLYLWEHYFSMLEDTIDIKFALHLGNSVRAFTVRLPKNPDSGLRRIADRFLFAYLYNLMISRGAERVGIYTEDESYTERLLRKLSKRFPAKEKRGKDEKPGYTHIRPTLGKVYGKRVDFYKVSREEIENIEHPNVNVIAETEIPLLGMLKDPKGVIAGVDAGGTDIKVVLYKDNKLIYAKEHNWNPGSFKSAEQHISTVEMLIKLGLIKLGLDRVKDSNLIMELERISDPRTGIERIREFIAMAEGRLGRDFYNRLSAAGISWPEVIVADRMIPYSGKVEGLEKLESPKREEELDKISRLSDEISRRFGKIPVAITNDGSIGAFWGSVELAKGNLVGISMGTSCGVGYIDREGKIPDMLTEMAKVVLDLSDDPDTTHDLTGVKGSVQKHLSQKGVFRLADRLGLDTGEDKVKIFAAKGYAERYGIDISAVDTDNVIEYVYQRLDERIREEYRKALVSKGERLRYIQSLLDSGDEETRKKAEEIFKEIGRYLACFIEQIYLYFDESGTRNFVLFGRVIEGRAGDIIIQTARDFIRDRFPWMPEANILLSTEVIDNPYADRLGQAIGAVFLGYKRLLENRVYRLIAELSKRGITARINDTDLSTIDSPGLLLKHITDYTPLKNPLDIIDILEARLGGRDEFLYNAVFNQREFLEGMDRPINIAMFRGGRGVGELTRLMKGMPNININSLLGGTDDGRSWYYAAQDFDATGVPDCGKTLLDLARDKDSAKLLETRLKGEDSRLRIEVNRLISDLQGGDTKIKPEKAQWIARYLKRFMERLERDFAHSRFSLNNIPVRSLVLLGAAWYYGNNWQKAIDETARLLDIRPGDKIAFTTQERLHLVGLTKDGTLYFTETGINEHPKKEDFVGLWLFKKKPDMDKISRMLEREGITLDSVEVPQGIPTELAREVFETSRQIGQKGRVEDTAIILAGLSYSEIGETVINSAAIDIMQNADLILYGPSSLESNIGSGLLPWGIQRLVQGNRDAVKIFFVNPTLENEPREITALDMLEKLYRYITRQQSYRIEDAVWEEGYIDFVLGRGLQYLPMDPRKRYIPFNKGEIEERTGGAVSPVELNLEWQRPILREKKDYGGHEKEYGFYSPQVMLENVIALWALKRKGYRIRNGRLIKDERKQMDLYLSEIDRTSKELEGVQDDEDARGFIKPNTRKYDENGRPQYFDGITTIVKIPQDTALSRKFGELIDKINRLQRDKDLFIATVPKDSGHVTTYDGVALSNYAKKYDEELNEETKREIDDYTSFLISRDGFKTDDEARRYAIYTVVTRRIGEALKELKLTRAPRFRPYRISHIWAGGPRAALVMDMIPETPEDLTLLTMIQDAIEKNTGIKGYGKTIRHLTLGYFVRPVSDKSEFDWFKHLIEELNRDIEGIVKDSQYTLTMQDIALSYFSDMTDYHTLAGFNIVNGSQEDVMGFNFHKLITWAEKGRVPTGPIYLLKTHTELLADMDISQLDWIYFTGEVSDPFPRRYDDDNPPRGRMDYSDFEGILERYPSGHVSFVHVGANVDHCMLQNFCSLLISLKMMQDEGKGPDTIDMHIPLDLTSSSRTTEEAWVKKLFTTGWSDDLNAGSSYIEYMEQGGFSYVIYLDGRPILSNTEGKPSISIYTWTKTGRMKDWFVDSKTQRPAIKVIRGFTGDVRIEGMEGLSKRLADAITASVKIASKMDVIASLPLAMTEGRYYILVDRNKVTKEMEEAIRRLEGNGVFKIVYEVPSDYDPKKIIHLLDPGDLKEDMREEILYLPMPYLRSSLYMAANIVSAGGEIAKVDPLVKGLIIDLYKITEDDLIDLFNAPWRLLPKVKGVINELNKLRDAWVEIEKAA